MCRVGRSVLLVLAALAAWSNSASAADVETAPVAPLVIEEVEAKPDWRFQATMYGWLAGLNGDIGVRGRGPVSIDIPPDEALSTLKGALMGAFSGNNGEWMFMADLMWVQIGDSGQIGDTLYGYDFSQTQITAEAVVGYRLPIAIPKLDVYATAGARYQNINAELDIGPILVPISVGNAGTVQWIDPIVGLNLRYDFADRWYLSAIGDVGGFGVSSNLTWQAFASVGYRWTDTISTSLGYRALYTDYESGGFTYDVTQQGVFAGLGIHF